MVDEFLSIKKNKIPAYVRDYVSAMEVERTNEWCKCGWIIHPDDVDIDPHNCANCHHPHLLHNPSCTKTIEPCECTEWVDPPKRRMRRGDQHPECPVHTKEGFILGFFEWVFSDDR